MVSTQTKSKADFFNLEKLEDDSFDIKLNPTDIEGLKRISIPTTRKIMNSDCTIVEEDQEGNSFVAIHLAKIYDLSAWEYSQIKQGTPLKNQLAYYSFVALLKESGETSDQEILSYLVDEKRLALLPKDIQGKAILLLKDASLNIINQDKENLTIFLRSRFCSIWELADTENLPQTLYEKLIRFLIGEMNHWESSPKKPITQQSTTVTDK